MVRYLYLCMTVFILLLSAPACASDSTVAPSLADRVVEAYGGEALSSLSTLRIRDEGVYSEQKYGFTPNLYEYDRTQSDFEIDFGIQRASYDYRVEGERFAYHNRNLVTDDDIVAISYALKTYEPEAFASFEDAFFAPMRRYDTIIVYWISQSPEDLKQTGTSFYLGRPHIIAEFDLPGTKPATLYFDSETYYLTRMDRNFPNWAGLTYLWSEHSSTDGLIYGGFFQQHIDNHAERISHTRTVSTQLSSPDAFKIDPGVTREPQRINTDVVSHQALSENVFLTGLKGSFSLFIETDDYVIAAGTTRGFKERYELFRERRPRKYPLRYVLTTHHAAPHLAGLADAVSLGAIVVAPDSHVATIWDSVGSVLPDSKMKILDQKLSLGPVEIYAITTSHADTIPLIYIPALQAVYQVDSYGNTYQRGPAFAGLGGVTFKQAIDRLGLNVKTILFVYSPEPGSYSDFEQSVERYIERPCYSARPLCQTDFPD